MKRTVSPYDLNAVAEARKKRTAPQDATLRNIRAVKTSVADLKREVKVLRTRVTLLEDAHNGLSVAVDRLMLRNPALGNLE